MTTRTLDYTFEQVPLIIDGAFEDDGVSGTAEITYYGNGEWSVGDISVEISRYPTAAERAVVPFAGRIRKQHTLDRTSWLYLTLYDRLENMRYSRSNIQEEVNTAIEEVREEAREFLGEQRREDRAMARL